MKTAIYLNEGTTQLVLTPENEWEKNIVQMLYESMMPHQVDEKVSAYRGEFYECQGGWYRHSQYPKENPESLIFRIDRQAKVPSE